MRDPRTDVASERAFAERTERAASQLRERRLARKLSQAALAKELGVTPNTIARWERRDVPIPHWVAPYLAMQDTVARLKLALAEKEEEQKKLREIIKTKNFELKVEKATRKSKGNSDELYQRLVKAFPLHRYPDVLRRINEIYLSLGRADPVIDVEAIRRV
jgi:transcriptional regulator with XRE-family HTH domain